MIKNCLWTTNKIYIFLSIYKYIFCKYTSYNHNFKYRILCFLQNHQLIKDNLITQSTFLPYLLEIEILFKIFSFISKKMLLLKEFLIFIQVQFAFGNDLTLCAFSEKIFSPVEKPTSDSMFRKSELRHPFECFFKV